MLRFFLHYGIHFLLPVVIAFLFYSKNRTWIILILWTGILIDLDHFLANPIFDPNRCSLGFHPLHSYWAVGAYAGLFLFSKTRLIALALLIHIFADAVDCFFLKIGWV